MPKQHPDDPCVAAVHGSSQSTFSGQNTTCYLKGATSVDPNGDTFYDLASRINPSVPSASFSVASTASPGSISQSSSLTARSATSIGSASMALTASSAISAPGASLSASFPSCGNDSGKTYTIGGNTLTVECSTNVDPGTDLAQYDNVPTLQGCLDLCAQYTARHSDTTCIAAVHGSSSNEFQGQQSFCWLKGTLGHNGPNLDPWYDTGILPRCLSSISRSQTASVSFRRGSVSSSSSRSNTVSSRSSSLRPTSSPHSSNVLGCSNNTNLGSSSAPGASTAFTTGSTITGQSSASRSSSSGRVNPC